MVQIEQLLLNAEDETVGNALSLGDYIIMRGALPIQIYGTFEGHVDIEGTISTQEEIDLGTAEWYVLENGVFTASELTALFAAPSHIRANAHLTDGSVSVRVRF